MARKYEPKKDEPVDQPVSSMGDYNNVPAPMPSLTPQEELELQNNPGQPAPSEDMDDGKSHRQLNFDSSQATPQSPGMLSKLRQMMGNVGDKFSQNLQASDKVIGDATDTMLDRVRMQNPNMSGPRLPNQPMPAELAESQTMANSIAGSMAPVGGFARLTGMVGKAAPSAGEAALAELQAATKAAMAKSIPEAQQVAPNMLDVVRKQQALSRGVDFEQRKIAQQAAMRAKRAALLKKLSGQ